MPARPVSRLMSFVRHARSLAPQRPQQARNRRPHSASSMGMDTPLAIRQTTSRGFNGRSCTSTGAENGTPPGNTWRRVCVFVSECPDPLAATRTPRSRASWAGACPRGPTGGGSATGGGQVSSDAPLTWPIGPGTHRVSALEFVHVARAARHTLHVALRTLNQVPCPRSRPGPSAYARHHARADRGTTPAWGRPRRTHRGSAVTGRCQMRVGRSS